MKLWKQCGEGYMEKRENEKEKERKVQVDRCCTHCANKTAGVKLWPSLSTSGIRSYQFRYCV
jgi:hypothetical protein